MSFSVGHKKSTPHVDFALFAGLTLGASDDEDGDADPSITPGHPVAVALEEEAENEESARPTPSSSNKPYTVKQSGIR